MVMNPRDWRKIQIALAEWNIAMPLSRHEEIAANEILRGIQLPLDFEEYSSTMLRGLIWAME
jgi:uncharacterized protein (DUF927 family)